MMNFLLPLIDRIGSIVNLVAPFFGRLTIRLNRDSAGTYFEFPDSSLSRTESDSITNYAVFSFELFSYSSYRVNIHRIDAYAYSFKWEKWIELSDKPLILSEKDKIAVDYVRDFQNKHERFCGAEIFANSSFLKFCKFGMFNNSGLVGGYRWKGWYYIDILVILHCNTSIFCLVCSIPKHSGVMESHAAIYANHLIAFDHSREKIQDWAKTAIKNRDSECNTARKTILRRLN